MQNKPKTAGPRCPSFCSQTQIWSLWGRVTGGSEARVTRRHTSLSASSDPHPLSVKTDRKQRKWRETGGGGRRVKKKKLRLTADKPQRTLPCTVWQKKEEKKKQEQNWYRSINSGFELHQIRNKRRQWIACPPSLSACVLSLCDGGVAGLHIPR